MFFSCAVSSAFEVRVQAPVSAAFGTGGADEHTPLTWFPISVTRKRDGLSTVVHRRFKDFAELDDNVR